MSLNKSIIYGKEHRKPYRGAKSIDRTCRNHGRCEWCKKNRIYKNEKKRDSIIQKIKEWEGK